MPTTSKRGVRPPAPLALSLLALLAFACAPAALAAPSTFTVSANKHYWLKDGAPFITVGFNRYDVWNTSDPANDGLTIARYVERTAQNGSNAIRV